MLDPIHVPPIDQRRVIFAALVETQDKSRSVHEAKQEILARFGLTWDTVEQIAREGLDNNWPPLDEAE